MKVINRDRIGRFASNTKRLIAESWRKAKIVAAIMTIGITAHSYFVWAETPVVVEAVEEKVRIEYVEVDKAHIPAIMQKIAKCESPTGHYKNGQVVINATMDAGKYQINVPIWSKTATKMGLDLFNEEDNETFALWLYETQGTEPWYSSKHCWNR